MAETLTPQGSEGQHFVAPDSLAGEHIPDALKGTMWDDAAEAAHPAQPEAQEAPHLGNTGGSEPEKRGRFQRIIDKHVNDIPEGADPEQRDSSELRFVTGRERRRLDKLADERGIDRPKSWEMPEQMTKEERKEWRRQERNRKRGLGPDSGLPLPNAEDKVDLPKSGLDWEE